MRRRISLIAVFTLVAACNSDTNSPTQLKSPAATPSYSVSTTQTFQSSSATLTWNAIVPPNPQDVNWYPHVCVAQPAVGVNDPRWTNPHQAYVANGAAFRGAALNLDPTFTADWVNAWPGYEWFGLTSSFGGPPGDRQQSWTKYSADISGTGDFVLELVADNCSWVYITDANGNNPQQVGFQSHDPREGGITIATFRYPVTLNGNHKLVFLVFDGGGQSGGMFKLTTNTNVVFVDTDGDGLSDVAETNNYHTNPNNPDTDGDGISDGDEVKNGSDPLVPAVIDSDHDGILDNADNCPATPNADQADLDGDHVGDVCDPDIDGDGHLNADDAYPRDPARWLADADLDGILDIADNCPAVPNADQADLDGDHVGDVCDPDIDGDGHLNADDAFPRDSHEWADTDHDGFGDNSDAFPADPTEWLDTDHDGKGNNSDNCVAVSNPSQADLDHDGIGDACDSDIDGDGYANNVDAFPLDSHEWLDSDGDGVGNNADPFDNSNTGPFILVGQCNTGAANWRVSGGTYANDLIADAYAKAANHGAFVSAVSDLADGWKKAGKISGRDQGAIVSCAARMK